MIKFNLHLKCNFQPLPITPKVAFVQFLSTSIRILDLNLRFLHPTLKIFSLNSYSYSLLSFFSRLAAYLTICFLIWYLKFCLKITFIVYLSISFNLSSTFVLTFTILIHKILTLTFISLFLLSAICSLHRHWLG